uniref:Uncharacterized protein n=1 Tax=Cacopsylla melanoneura TaxID=428564 RepID=A0A8D8SAX7_9HEMI
MSGTIRPLKLKFPLLNIFFFKKDPNNRSKKSKKVGIPKQCYLSLFVWTFTSVDIRDEDFTIQALVKLSLESQHHSLESQHHKLIVKTIDKITLIQVLLFQKGIFLELGIFP